jgi:hypothetical protein
MDTTRRGFLATTVAAGGAAATQNMAHAADEAAHDHQALPSDPALRVKSLESLLVEKGLVDPAALDAVVDTYEHKVGPRSGARWWRGPGSIRPTRRAFWPMAGPRFKNSAMAAPRARTRWRWRIRRACTTSSSAPCAPVIHGRSWACLRSGTSRRPTARGRSSIRAGCCASSGWRSRTM